MLYIKVAGTQLYRDFEKYYEEIRILYPSIERIQRSGLLTKQDYSDWSRFSKVFTEFIRTGIKVSTYVMEHKEVPANKTKRMEVSMRTFLSISRMPTKPLNWITRNEKNFQTLLESKQYPDKQVGSDSLFQEGNFLVHNTINVSGRELEKFKRIIQEVTRMSKSSGVPNLTKTLYGDVYFVAKIRQANLLAWYDYGKDTISVRISKDSEDDLIRSFIHELGHRLWRKFLSRPIQEQWVRYHSQISSSDVKVEMPKVGEPLGLIDNKGQNPIIQKIVGTLFFISDTEFFQYRDIKKHLQRQQAYPTVYASTSYEEHFCEALAMYVTNTLPRSHAEMFEKIIVRGGTV